MSLSDQICVILNLVLTFNNQSTFLFQNFSLMNLLNRIILVTFFFLLFVCFSIYAQSKNKIRLGFYNVENFYDVFTDSTREYNAFTQEGDQHWDYNRFQSKRNNIYKVIVALGEGIPPAIMGFCEVENDIVLRELIYKTPLKKFNYQYVNYPSPDRRGIDVAIIYRTDLMRLLSSKPIPVVDPVDSSFKTRDILYASFIISDIDTLHFFVNHWPSRYGGVLSSMNKRMLVARILKHQTDSIFNSFPRAKIVIMGDFNDCPNDESLLKGLQIGDNDVSGLHHNLINLFGEGTTLGFDGTLKHEHQWQIFDQIIVSDFIFNASDNLKYDAGSARIFTAPYLLTEDERYLGKKTFRTYSGPSYIGGFSDHLPIYIDLEWNEKTSITN